MLAYIRQGQLIYARGLTSTGQFTHETAATTGAGASSQPSVKINPNNEWQMIVWAQADGTHYAYRNAHGWDSYRVMKGSVSAARVRHERPSQDRRRRRSRRAVGRAAHQRLVEPSPNRCAQRL